MKLRKKDTVIITRGKDKGKRGKVERVFAKKKKVLVAGLNVYKRHLKKRSEKNPAGIIEFSRPLPMANVAVICPKCDKKTRVGFSLDKTDKQRICKKCQQVI